MKFAHGSELFVARLQASFTSGETVQFNCECGLTVRVIWLSWFRARILYEECKINYVEAVHAARA